MVGEVVVGGVSVSINGSKISSGSSSSFCSNGGRK